MLNAMATAGWWLLWLVGGLLLVQQIVKVATYAHLRAKEKYYQNHKKEFNDNE